MNDTQRVAQHIVNTTYESLPDETIARIKVRLLDAMGVIIAGAHAPGIDGAVAMAKNWGGAAESSIFIHGVKVPAANAAFVNGMMMRSYDFEMVEAEGPDGKSGPGHISGSSVPTALAMAEANHRSGKDLVTALALGDDLASRLSMGTGFAFGAGWDNTGTFNGLGCTAIAARLLRLDAEQTANAFGIVLNQLGGSMDGVRDHAMSFKLPQGLSARNAIYSAELAKTGFIASRDAINGRHGYFNLFGGQGVNPATVTDQLGQVYYGDCHIKPWPGCRLTHPSADCTLQIMEQYKLDPASIEKVILHVHPATELVDSAFEPGAVPQVDGLFNVRYIVATAITQGSVETKHHTDTYHHDPAILDMIKRIDIDYERPQPKMLSADVDFILKDGRILSAHVDMPKGSLKDRPMSPQEIMAKFNSNVAASNTVSHENAEKIVETVNRIADVEDISSLTDLLTV